MLVRSVATRYMVPLPATRRVLNPITELLSKTSSRDRSHAERRGVRSLELNDRLLALRSCGEMADDPKGQENDLPCRYLEGDTNSNLFVGVPVKLGKTAASRSSRSSKRRSTALTEAPPPGVSDILIFEESRSAYT